MERVSSISCNVLEFTDRYRMIFVDYVFYKLVYAKIIKRKGFIWS